VLKPLVSVITATHNDAHFLKKALESLQRQTYTNFEHVIIDDGSTDEKSLEALNDYRLEHKFSMLTLSNCCGLPAARNAGIEVANGTYILPLDCDDYISDNFIELCVSAVESNTEKVSPVYGNTQMWGELDTYLDNPKWTISRLLSGPFIPATALFSKSAWNEVGGYDNTLSLWEDYELWVSFAFKGYIGRKISGPILYYNIRRDSMSDHFNLKKGAEEKKEAFFYILSKHGFRPSPNFVNK
tara:strand:- start:274 stop:999 length:726 start_codon:yes stop_codon:yes gene_type:complete